MLDIGASDHNYKVTGEVRKIIQFHPVCIFGIEESAVIRSRFGEAGAKIITIPGNHHYNDNPAAAADAIYTDATKKLSK